MKSSTAVRHIASYCARRRQLALLVEKLETLTNTPARSAEQAALKAQAVADLLERVR